MGDFGVNIYIYMNKEDFFFKSPQKAFKQKDLDRKSLQIPSDQNDWNLYGSYLE